MDSVRDSSGNDSSGSRERQRVEKDHLPRLAPEWYRGRAFVHWTLTTENRATGWLTPDFHHTWRLVLLHACARFELICPVYVLMPDHAHLICLGVNDHGSDQRVAIEFLRKHLRPHLAPAEWQRQPYDNVLRESDRAHDAFQNTARYIFDNPVRASLVTRWQDYPHAGCCVAGYPEFEVRADGYWERFWRCYNYVVEKLDA